MIPARVSLPLVLPKFLAPRGTTARYLTGRYSDAIWVLERARVRTPNIPFVYVTLAAAYAQTGRHREAKQTATRVVRLRPFCEVEFYGSAFRNPADRPALQEGLRKAGLK